VDVWSVGRVGSCPRSGSPGWFCRGGRLGRYFGRCAAPLPQRMSRQLVLFCAGWFILPRWIPAVGLNLCAALLGCGKGRALPPFPLTPLTWDGSLFGCYWFILPLDVDSPGWFPGLPVTVCSDCCLLLVRSQVDSWAFALVGWLRTYGSNRTVEFAGVEPVVVEPGVPRYLVAPAFVVVVGGCSRCWNTWRFGWVVVARCG
jgi:hypothetical protein